MSSQMGSRMNTYRETIEGLKRELETHVANLSLRRNGPIL